MLLELQLAQFVDPSTETCGVFFDHAKMKMVTHHDEMFQMQQAPADINGRKRKLTGQNVFFKWISKLDATQ